MKMRQSRREELAVNLTPLIDVVFLLLIFFMVSTTFNRQSEIVVNLPEAASQAQEVKVEPLEVTIDANGTYFVNRQQLINTQQDTLIRAIRAALNEREDVPMIISADAQTPHQAVVTAMDAARQLGIVNLSIATKGSHQD